MKNKLVICSIIGSLFMFTGCGSKENAQTDSEAVSGVIKSTTEVDRV